jgi:hypothetical protein
MRKLLLGLLALALSACATYQDGYGYTYRDGAYYGEQSDYRYSDSYPGYGYGGYYRPQYGYGVRIDSYPAYGYRYRGGYAPYAGYGHYAPRPYVYPQHRRYDRDSAEDGAYRLRERPMAPIDPGAGSLRGRDFGDGGGYRAPEPQRFDVPAGAGSRMGISESLRPAQRSQPTMDSGAFSAPTLRSERFRDSARELEVEE